MGYVVCHRGRGGFKLTDKGEALYRLSVREIGTTSMRTSAARRVRDPRSPSARIDFRLGALTNAGA